MKIKPLTYETLKTVSLADRKSKVNREMFGSAWTAGGNFSHFLSTLPRILASSDLITVGQNIVNAVRRGKKIILGMGAHPIKVGLNPIIIDLVKRGVISGIAMNGACVIHDSEIAMQGCTSEDVASGLGCGAFGMAEETAVFINKAVNSGYKSGLGLGHAVGKAIVEKNLPFASDSIIAQAFRHDIPATIHVAIGTDIIHFHPSFDSESTGGASHLDFRIFCSLVSSLKHGVYINLGSAVILPEVFLKALSLVRNLGHDVTGFSTVNLDFIRQYRPMTNVVQRPTQEGGKGFHITGHHEIMFPLLAALIIEGLE